MVDSKLYPPASDDSYDENDVMPGNVEDFANEIVGHRIVRWDHTSGNGTFELDNGKTVTLRASSDCCAYTDLDSVLEKLPTMDHMITAVVPDGAYRVWHIMAGMNEVMDLEVGWCAGSGYYMYGFYVEVED